MKRLAFWLALPLAGCGNMPRPAEMPRATTPFEWVYETTFYQSQVNPSDHSSEMRDARNSCHAMCVRLYADGWVATVTSEDPCFRADGKFRCVFKGVKYRR